jgi:hypothetical protein
LPYYLSRQLLNHTTSASKNLKKRKRDTSESTVSQKNKKRKGETAKLPMSSEISDMKQSSRLDTAENIRLTNLQQPGLVLSFAGTDYGLKTMAVTAPVSMECYQFHLDLFHRSTPNTSLVINREMEKYLQLPKTFNIKAGNIRHRAMIAQYSKSLQKRKAVSVSITYAEF